uniref:Uncharacterized protein n=1 Tax=Cucumis melo TaxID=3656 RepID=A0A9I9EJ51_CUCME
MEEGIITIIIMFMIINLQMQGLSSLQHGSLLLFHPLSLSFPSLLSVAFIGLDRVHSECSF